MSLLSRNYPNLYRTVSLRDFVAGDRLMVQTSKSGFSQDSLCEFIEIEKGMVKVKVLECFLERGQYPYEELKVGNIIRRRANKCFLWVKSSGQAWASYHWFKNLNDTLNG